MSWEDKELGELTLYVKRGVSPKYVLENGIPIVNQRCIRENTINFDTARLSSKDKKITEVKFLQVGDTLINSTGVGTLGRTAYVKKLDQPSSADTHVTIVRPNKTIIDPKYLSLYLNAKEDIIENMGKGATGQTELSAKDLSSLNVFYPKSLQTQKRIADILSAYDDLIENNLKRIKLLEQAAQNIYKEWFVNLRFPGHKNTPINKETGLPEGWEEDFIDNQLERVKRNGKLKKDDYLEVGDYPIIDQSDGFIGGYSNKEEVVQFEPLPLVIFGDHTRRVKYANFPFISGADGTQLLSPLNKNMLPAYFYLSIKSIDLSDYAYARHFKYLKQQTILIPDNETLKLFNDKVYPMLEQNLKLFTFNQKLKAARDILLPRLMNRTIKV